jgi:hypothetical protein
MGWITCMILFLALYYGNVWNALSAPFLSQQLFSQQSNSSLYDIYNQTRILDDKFELDSSRLEQEGLPFFAATYASYLLTTNLGVTSTIVHVGLWHWDAIRNAFNLKPRKPNFNKLRLYMKQPKLLFKTDPTPRTQEELESMDPHYRAMLVYKEVPGWWYVSLLFVSIVVGMICIYTLESTLPWWGLLIAIMISFIGTLFSGALSGLLGFGVPVTSVVQLIGGYLHPGKPVANMVRVSAQSLS